MPFHFEVESTRSQGWSQSVFHPECFASEIGQIAPKSHRIPEGRISSIDPISQIRGSSTNVRVASTFSDAPPENADRISRHARKNVTGCEESTSGNRLTDAPGAAKTGSIVSERHGEHRADCDSRSRRSHGDQDKCQRSMNGSTSWSNATWTI